MPTRIATWNGTAGVWETDERALCGHLELYSETWPTSGWMRGGSVFALYRIFVAAYPGGEAGLVGAGLRAGDPAGLGWGRPDDDGGPDAADADQPGPQGRPPIGRAHQRPARAGGVGADPAQLKALGNGVVPQQATHALRLLLTPPAARDLVGAVAETLR